MLLSDVRQLTSEQRFGYWITERTNIYNYKTFGIGTETNDEIFQKYHFTNVQRENDRVSKWLMDNLYLMGVDNPWGIILVSRFVNNPLSLQHITDELISNDWNQAKEILVELSKSMTVFRSAYLQPEIKGVNRFDKIFDYLLPNVLQATISTDSIEGGINDLMKIKYLGEFISGQMVMDGMLFIGGTWSDRNTYAPMGPGSIRGINRYFDLPINDKVHPGEYLGALNNLATEKNLRALDIEHSLCEWDKYERILWDDGSYKRYYKK